MFVLAHAGHWLTSIAYFMPVLAFAAWLALTNFNARRSEGRGGAGNSDVS